MAQLIYIVERLLAGQLSLTRAITEIRALLSAGATYEQAETIRESVQLTELAVITGAHNLGILDGKLDALSAALAGINAPVLAAIAALPAGSDLPTAGQIAGGVWAQIDPFSDSEALMYGEELANAHRWATFAIRGGGLPSGYASFFVVRYPPPAPDSIPTVYTWPEPDWSDIRADDTLGSWLARTCPDFTWVADGSGEDVWGYLTSLYEPDAPHYMPRLTSTEWLRVYGALSHHAPVWPGLDYVTLGTPVALAQGTAVNEPCDGLLLAVATTERIIPFMTAGPYKLYRNLGRVVFLSDAPNVEHWQGIPADQCVLVPKAIARASGALLSFYTGVTGTVTPWVVTPVPPPP